jgi:hypothetical protein
LQRDEPTHFHTTRTPSRHHHSSPPRPPLEYLLPARALHLDWVLCKAAVENLLRLLPLLPLCPNKLGQRGLLEALTR